MSVLIFFADHAVWVWGVIVLALSVVIWLRWTWITTNIPVAAALGTIIALFVTSAFATLQPAMTRIALQNNLIYLMQKDAREAGTAFDNNKATSAEVFAVMQSIYIQYQLGSINSYAWSGFVRDFCSVMQQERMRREWQSATKSSYTGDFKSFVDGLVAQSSSTCS